MAKKVSAVIKLQIPGGKCTPAPPVGPALGGQGVNIAQFVKEFNDRTKDSVGTIIPVVITVYQDKSFSFVTKTPPAPVMLKEVAKIEKGAHIPNKETVATVTWADCLKIAETKLKDTNATDLEACARMIEGTAKQMGIKVTKD